MLDPTQLSDHIRLDNHDIYGARNYSLRARKTAENYANLKEGLSTRTTKNDHDDGTSTPPLWRSSSPPTSPPHRHHHFRTLSPSSRAEAIARGQREMMEMVSKLPEGCYELSLKDIVEHPMIQEIKQQERLEECFSKERNNINERNGKVTRKKVQINRNGSVNNGGFLLKMVFPVSWGSGKKKKKINRNNSNGKDGRVSPKPLLFEGSGKSVDEEWWKNRYQVSGESESGGFSSNSGSSKSSRSSSSRSISRNSSRRMRGGCCTFIFNRRGKKSE